MAAMRGMQNSIMQAKQRNIQELRKLYNLYRPKREKRVKKKAESEYTLKEKVHCLLDPTALFPNEKYHNVSIAISLSIFVIIFISIVTFVLESVPEYESKQTYQIIESICVTIFTVEFMLKLSTCPSFRLFVRDLYNWIDLISILPFYVDIFVEAVLNRKNNVNLLFLRVIRLARIFRMFKLGKYNKPFGMVCTKRRRISIIFSSKICNKMQTVELAHVATTLFQQFFKLMKLTVEQNRWLHYSNNFFIKNLHRSS